MISDRFLLENWNVLDLSYTDSPLVSVAVDQGCNIFQLYSPNGSPACYLSRSDLLSWCSSHGYTLIPPVKNDEYTQEDERNFSEFAQSEQRRETEEIKRLATKLYKMLHK